MEVIEHNSPAARRAFIRAYRDAVLPPFELPAWPGLLIVACVVGLLRALVQS